MRRESDLRYMDLCDYLEMPIGYKLCNGYNTYMKDEKRYATPSFPHGGNRYYMESLPSQPHTTLLFWIFIINYLIDKLSK